MKIAVVGAGVTGLVAARRLTKLGHQCDVYERWPGLGGQVATLDVGGRDPLERYYHHLFTSDQDIDALYRELGMADAIEWLPSSVGVFARGSLYPFTSPLDLLRFTPMGLAGRVRMGLAVVLLQRRHRDVTPFEAMTAREWVLSAMGPQAWEEIWGPLLRGKFGERAEHVSMAWLWSKLTLRRQVRGREARKELLGYPHGGWQPLLDRLSAEIEANGGRVLIDRPAARVEVSERGPEVTPARPGSFRMGHDPGRFEAAGPPEPYEAVLATVPSDVFAQLLGERARVAIDAEYAQRLRTEYQAACCLLLELDRRFSPYYWTNVSDPRLGFVGLIEHTNLVSPERYGGKRFLYVANYLARDDPLLEMGADQLLDRYLPGLRLVNPSFERSWVRSRWVFHEPAAQPIVTVGYRERIPAMRTPAPGVFLANTTQIYPEDRGTNYSVRLGERAARLVAHEFEVDA